MKFTVQDFPLIRTSVVLLLASAFLGIASIIGSQHLKDLMRHYKLIDRKHMIEARTKLDRVREEEQQIRSYQTEYQKLINQGTVGNENRLALIESIARIKTERKLFEFGYQIAAQQPVQTDMAFAQSEFSLHGSPMKLSFAVLHEEDWLNALADLKKDTGVSLLHECTVIRNATDNAAGPKLKVDCAIIWLSLTQKNGVAPSDP